MLISIDTEKDGAAEYGNVNILTLPNYYKFCARERTQIQCSKCVFFWRKHSVFFPVVTTGMHTHKCTQVHTNAHTHIER